MSFAFLRHCAVVAVLASAPLAPCFATDTLGTAGPIRSAGGDSCNGDFEAAARGACDPPPVESTLSPERRSQARVERARRLIALLRMEQAILELNAAVTEDPSSGAAGSSLCEPIQMTPASSSTVSAGIDQTTSSTWPEYSKSGR